MAIVTDPELMNPSKFIKLFPLVSPKKAIGNTESTVSRVKRRQQRYDVGMVAVSMIGLG